MALFEYLQYFFRVSHLFNLRPSLIAERGLWIIVIVSVAFIVGGIVAKVAARRSRNGLAIKGYRKMGALGVTMGIFGLLYWFVAYEGVPLFSARFWILIWGLVAIIWAGFIFKYFWRDIPQQRGELDQRRKYAKYLP